MLANNQHSNKKGFPGFLKIIYGILGVFVLVIVDLPDVFAKFDFLRPYAPHIIAVELIIIVYLIIVLIENKKIIKDYQINCSSSLEECKLILDYLMKEQKDGFKVINSKEFKDLVVKINTGNMSSIDSVVLSRVDTNLKIVQKLQKHSRGWVGIWYKFLLGVNRIYIRFYLRRKI